MLKGGRKKRCEKLFVCLLVCLEFLCFQLLWFSRGYLGALFLALLELIWYWFLELQDLAVFVLWELLVFVCRGGVELLFFFFVFFFGFLECQGLLQHVNIKKNCFKASQDWLLLGFHICQVPWHLKAFRSASYWGAWRCVRGEMCF
jgi:hypothetical protein